MQVSKSPFKKQLAIQWGNEAETKVWAGLRKVEEPQSWQQLGAVSTPSLKGHESYDSWDPESEPWLQHRVTERGCGQTRQLIRVMAQWDRCLHLHLLLPSLLLWEGS